jgi:hypothetical protein
MPWECLNCGKFNNDALVDCEKCLLNKATATSAAYFPKKRHFCEECGHKHLERTYCHTYRPVTADDLEEDEEEEEEEEILGDSDKGSDDEDLAIGKASSKDNNKSAKSAKSAKPAQSAKSRKSSKSVAAAAADGTGGEVIVLEEDDGDRTIKPLPTPKFVSRIYYMRCNCLVGVPSNSRRFEPIPTKLMVGDICVKFYEEALELFDQLYNENHKNFHFRKIQKKLNTKPLTPEEIAANRARFGEILPLVCRFLPVGVIANPAKVSTAWNYGCSLYKEYVDMRDAVPWSVVRSHEGQVDTVLIVDRMVYSGADRQVYVTDMERGEVIAKVMRDSGDIRYLSESEHELFCCSSNGSIRTYLLTHDHSNAQLVGENTMFLTHNC